ncbi:major facilitator superfamily domain-containing protein [Lipomyces japonicus]|uniref:major facilitator superfamily domain-containing protein n=1 Tax=Lipomyces japonicus TaxID=56871 RepID=UPI0034CFBBAF
MSSHLVSAAIDLNDGGDDNNKIIESVIATESERRRQSLSVRRPSNAITRPSKTLLINTSNWSSSRQLINHDDDDGGGDANLNQETADAIELSELVISPDRTTEIAILELESPGLPSILENDNFASQERDSGEFRHAVENQAVRKFTLNNPPMNKWRMVACCWTIFGLGLNDGAPGALLPYIEKYYDVNYAEVSTIWMANALGFIITAICSHYVYTHIGRVGMLTAGPALLVCMYIMISATPPFPVVVVAYLFGGLGMAFVVAHVNVFCSYLENTESWYGVVHGSYGIGATISPLIATVMVSKGILWSRYFLILLAFNVFGAILSGWSFRGCDRDFGTHHLLKSYKKQRLNAGSESVLPVGVSADHLDNVDDGKEESIYRQAIRSKITWLAAIFILLYQGVEVSIGGWIVSFMINDRGGNPSAVGYVASGFWLGVTVGRFILSRGLSRLMTPQKAVYVLITIALAFEIVTWLVPNIIGGAVAVSLVGLFVGPMYPSAMATLTTILPRQIQTFSITLITAFGSTGGALWPFITGLLAQSEGTFVLHPVAISLFGTMLVCWYMVPAIPKKKD